MNPAHIWYLILWKKYVYPNKIQESKWMVFVYTYNMLHEYFFPCHFIIQLYGLMGEKPWDSSAAIIKYHRLAKSQVCFKVQSFLLSEFNKMCFCRFHSIGSTEFLTKYNFWLGTRPFNGLNKHNGKIVAELGKENIQFVQKIQYP